MSAGRHWNQELYVGFLLLALSFLYLSHLSREVLRAEAEDLAKTKEHSQRLLSSVESPAIAIRSVM
ncbi:MAG TPA: hypothetical protein VIH99_14105 [Bdellovibrionota bacterium]